MPLFLSWLYQYCSIAIGLDSHSDKHIPLKRTAFLAPWLTSRGKSLILAKEGIHGGCELECTGKDIILVLSMYPMLSCLTVPFLCHLHIYPSIPQLISLLVRNPPSCVLQLLSTLLISTQLHFHLFSICISCHLPVCVYSMCAIFFRDSSEGNSGQRVQTEFNIHTKRTVWRQLWRVCLPMFSSSRR